MRHPYFHKAVMDAYEQLIPAGEQISYFIYFEVDPANIDVNIHPTKTEIKFENEQAIWQILSAAVKESLGKFNAVPSIDFDTEGMPDIPAFEQSRPIEPPKVHYNADFNPFKTSSASSYGGGGNYSRQSVEWEGLYSGLEKASKMNEPVMAEEPLISGKRLLPWQNRLRHLPNRLCCTPVSLLRWRRERSICNSRDALFLPP